MNHYASKNPALLSTMPRPKKESLLVEASVAEVLKSSPNMTNHAIAALIGVSPRTVSRAIAFLETSGALRRETAKVKLAKWYNVRQVEILT